MDWALQMNVRTCVAHIYTQVQAHAYMYVHVCVYMHTCVHSDTHTHTYTHTHTHTHTHNGLSLCTYCTYNVTHSFAFSPVVSVCTIATNESFNTQVRILPVCMYSGPLLIAYPLDQAELFHYPEYSFIQNILSCCANSGDGLYVYLMYVCMCEQHKHLW